MILLGEKYEPITIHSHKEYNHETIENDIAIFQVSRPISTPAVCLPPPFEEFIGENGIVLGIHNF